MLNVNVNKCSTLLSTYLLTYLLIPVRSTRTNVPNERRVVRFESGKKATFWNPPPPRGVIYEK